MAEPSYPHIGMVQGVNLTVSLCLTYTAVIVCVRLWIRKGAFGFDDALVFVTTAFSIGHTAADYVALGAGLGQAWEDLLRNGSLTSLNSASIAGVIMFAITLYLTKLCVLAFLCRITKNKSQIRVYYSCAVVLAVLGIISLLVVTAGCSSNTGFYWAFLDNARSCPSQLVRWQVFTALDVVTEMLLLALPIQLVWSLQMPVAKKAMVLTAFFLRSPVIAFTLVRNYYTLKLRQSGSDPGWDGALVVIWIEIELTYALAASTLSALKSFTESFNSGFGQGFIRGRGDTYGLSGISNTSDGSRDEKRRQETKTGESGDPSTTSSRGRRTFGDRLAGKAWPSALRLRPDGNGNITRVSAEPGRTWRNENSGSEGSRDDLVIVRETELSVHHDEAPLFEPRR